MYQCTELSEEKMQSSISHVCHELKTKKWYPPCFVFASGFEVLNSSNGIF